MLYKTAFVLAISALRQAYAQNTGNFTYLISEQQAPNFFCTGTNWGFELVMTAATNVNSLGFHQPMAETGLPNIQFNFLTNGVASPITISNPFGGPVVANTGNSFTMTLADDNPSYGGQITFNAAPCTGPQPTWGVQLFSNSFIMGQATNVVTPPVPAVNGVANIANGFPAAHNLGGSVNGVAVSSTTGTTTSGGTGTGTTTTKPTTAAPTTAATMAAGNITYVVAPNSPLSWWCGAGNQYNTELVVAIKTFVNGQGGNQPMAETGLPNLTYTWTINGKAVPVTISNPFGGPVVSNTGNSFTMTLTDDDPSYGGGLAFNAPCTQGVVPQYTVAITSTSFITAVGVPPTIPAAQGIANVVNQFPAANNAGGSVGGVATALAQVESISSSASAGSSSMVIIGASAAGVLVLVAAVALVVVKRQGVAKSSSNSVYMAPLAV